MGLQTVKYSLMDISYQWHEEIAKSRKMYLFQRADWVGYKNQMESFSNTMLSVNSDIQVNDMWQTLKDE